MTNSTGTTDGEQRVQAASGETPVLASTDQTAAPAPRRRAQLIETPANQLVSIGGENTGIQVTGWLVGGEFQQHDWERTVVLEAARGAGLDEVVITGGRLDRMNEFQRACRSVERDEDASGPRRLLVRLENGQEVGINAHIVTEVKPVTTRRSGNAYQLKRRIKFFTEDVANVLVGGEETQRMLQRALGARDDRNHEITQDVGIWSLAFPDDANGYVEPMVEAHVLRSFQEDPTNAIGWFNDLTERVRERFVGAHVVYTEADIKNAWHRTVTAMTGAFWFRAGGGGFVFVPARWKPTVDAWATVLRVLYGFENMVLIPLTTVEEAQRALHSRAVENARIEQERIIRETMEYFERAKDRKFKDGGSTLEGIVEASLAVKLHKFAEDQAEINKALAEQFRVAHAALDPETTRRLKAAITDPRLKSIFVSHRVLEDDEDWVPARAVAPAVARAPIESFAAEQVQTTPPSAEEAEPEAVVPRKPFGGVHEE